MEENRDQILSDFQSCTGLEDIGECLMYLENSDWNLLDAVHNFMPQETQTLPSEHTPLQDPKRNSPIPMDEDIMEIAAAQLPPPPPAHPSTSNRELFQHRNNPVRMLKFLVKHQDRTVPIDIPDSETVGSLKSALFTEIGVTPCRQELKGWKRNHMTDETILSSLNLPSQTHLQVTTPDVLSMATDNRFQTDSAERYNTMFNILVVDASSRPVSEHSLKFSGSKTVLEMKQDIDTLTSIPVRFQRWSGWPDAAVDENMTLAALNLNQPVHRLTLDRESTRVDDSMPIIDLAGSDSSVEEFEDTAECFPIDDDLFPLDRSRKSQPLMPENVVDEAGAVSHFCYEFANRYSDYRFAPVFFQGTFIDSLQASCHKPAKERKPLVVYLHHDASVLTNVFCAHLLCNETVVNYLTLNFVTWAWDLSFESNKARFLASVTQHLGVAASAAVRNISVNTLPALMVISKVRSTTEVLTVVPGSVTLDELMTRLMNAVEMFSSGLIPEIKEEEEREVREQVKREQDEAYEESLMADRLKDQTRKQEEEAKQREEQEKQHLEAIKEVAFHLDNVLLAVRLSLAQQLPSEPECDSPKPVSHIRVRLPDGQMVDRRFLATDTLKVLLMYLASLGYPAEEFKVLASWPKRDLSALDPKSTLQELQLCPKETVTLEQR